ncbi:MAG: AAA family ATPase [Bacteroidales bacterium]|nr:AAA family ATPase [Bacteroidales bacterium]
MQLVAFRIQNFRSVVDSGWQQLSHDNITSLIGQNESGKTSILEALKAYHDGNLIEDMLRSDLSLPEVTCRFNFQPSDIENRIDLKRLDPKIRKVIRSIEKISLKRHWEDDMDSHMVMGDELMEIYNETYDQIKKRELKVYENLKNLSRGIAASSKSVNKANDEFESTREKVASVKMRINEIKRTLRKFSGKDKKDELKKEMVLEKEMLEKLNEALEQKKTRLEEMQDILDALDEKHEASKKFETINNQIAETKEELVVAQDNLRVVLQMTGMYSTDKEQRAAEIKEEIYRTDIEKLKEEVHELQSERDIQLLSLEFVFEGLNHDSAIQAARKEIGFRNKFYSSRELAEEIFKILPDFELFEDFSSLLPNRIDLEDIIRANKRAEGYKAAINFLTITGLEYSFFQQPSSRILKQKIENLNGEITLNFQDFWRQKLGKNNKIKINFELSHYDYTNPEKSGKPYIEFWIKDEQERLYPKQRSRGVRWFLSFFLELKATAMDKSRRNKVLLIDEPGVSLHARAQEDVLTVFDDIKEQMQIIYTTHSPHLIDVNKLYRILAVQRAVEDDMKSETLIFSARSLKSATADTLSPIYSTMGARLSQQEIIKSFNNVIVKDLATYYFLKAIIELTGFEKECYFLPASGTKSIPMMVNILIGWGLDYVILNFGNSEERSMHENLRKALFDNKIDLANQQMMLMDECMDAEDLLSTIDFKKYVIQVREGITVRNSEYLKDNNYSRAVLASNFLQEVSSGKVSYKKLDDESRENLNRFTQRLTAMLK